MSGGLGEAASKDPAPLAVSVHAEALDTKTAAGRIMAAITSHNVADLEDALALFVEAHESSKDESSDEG